METQLINEVLRGGIGVVALLILIMWMGKNSVWVWARELEAMRKEREKEAEEKIMWRELALQGTALMEHASHGKRNE